MNQKLEKICFVLFGETGHGKSTLGNGILGKEIFKTNDTMQSVTKEIYESNGIGKSENIFVIDTPGLNDSEGKENEYLKKLANYLKKRTDIKGIIVVLNFNLNAALQNCAEKSFKTIFKIFKSESICTNIIVTFTHFYGRKQPKRNEQGELKEKIFQIFKDSYYYIFNQNCPINSLPFYFLDIQSIEDLDSESQMEIDGMIATIFSKNSINPSIIQIKDNYDVKEELSSFRTIEDFDRYEGDFIFKKKKNL
jgi:GTP-binding protein EngB required for normal cell division